ncbi:MAG: NAD-dependent epimerase/dehydratase family protein [Planctomycetota bacterium]
MGEQAAARQAAGAPASLLLTGANGFLGRALVRRLLASGVASSGLRCVVRDVDRAVRAGLPAESLVRADLAAGAAGPTLERATAGVDVVVHLAGALKAYRRAGFDAVNAAGTRRLVEAVRRSAPSAHVVNISSLAAAGPSLDGAGSAAPPDACRPVSHYGESKRQGELAVVESGLDYTIVRPPVVYGPTDGATRLLFRQATALAAAAPPRPRPLSIVHADDVAEAVWRAVCARPPAACIPLDGPARTDTHALLRAIATACGRRARLLPVPMALASAAGLFADLVAAARRQPAYFNRDKVREIGAAGWVADGAAASQLLGFTPSIGLAEGLRAVAAAEGFVPATS